MVDRKELAGKTALITGAGKFSGIGFGIAQKMAEAGANIVLTDLGAPDSKSSPMPLGSVAEMKDMTLRLVDDWGIKAMGLEMDVSSTDSVQSAMERVKEEFGRLDFLFNNAGAVFGAPQKAHEYDELAWVKTIDINMHGVFRVSKAAVPLMTPGPAAIVNIASRAGKRPAIYNGAYSVAKAGVIMLTKLMAQELADQGIRVNAICPGLIKTDLQTGNIALKSVAFNTEMEGAEKKLTEAIPLSRMGTIQEAGELALFLASEKSSYITGQAINLCGGDLIEL